MTIRWLALPSGPGMEDGFEKGQRGVSTPNDRIGMAQASITKKCEEEDKLCCITYRIS